METQQKFIYLFKTQRDNFLETMTPEEKYVMGGHSAYTKKLSDEGIILMRGACTDGSYGIVVFQAKSSEEARTIFEADPAVQAGIFHTEVHPFHIAYMTSFTDH
jgi:uncharacterized protein YciI